MRYRRLKLENWRQHVATDIEFGDGLTGIIGLNGHGKSSILEAIAVTLWGSQAASTNQDAIPHIGMGDGEVCRSEFEFDLRGVRWRAVREPGKATLFRNGTADCSGSNACIARIAELFGMSYPEWINTFMTPQKGVDWLKGKRRADRERFLSETLGYGKLKDAQQRSREDSRDVSAKISVLETWLLSAERLAEIEAQLARSTEALVAADQRVAEAEVAKEFADEALAVASDEVQRFTGLSEKHAELTKQLEERSSELSDARTKASELDGRLSAAREEVAGLPVARELLAEATEHAKAAAEINDERQGIAREADAAKERSQKKFEEAQAVYARATQAAGSASRQLGEMKAMRGSADCPTCHQELGDGFELAIELMEARSVESTQLVKEARKAAAAAEQLLDAAKKSEKLSRAAAADAKERAQEQEHERQRAAERVAEIEKKRAALDEGEERLAKRRQMVTDLESAVGALTESREALGYDAEAAAAATRQLDSARLAAQAAAKTLQEAREATGTLKSEFASLQAENDADRRNRTEVETLKRDRMVTTASDRLFGELRGYLNERIRPELGMRATSLISDMSAGEFTGLWLDEDYAPVLESEGQRIPGSASGGEWDIANLALRIATSQLIADRSGQSLEAVAMDEPLGSLDPDRKQLMMDALRNVQERRFGQVIVVTHEPFVHDLVDHLVVVQRTGWRACEAVVTKNTA